MSAEAAGIVASGSDGVPPAARPPTPSFFSSSLGQFALIEPDSLASVLADVDLAAEILGDHFLAASGTLHDRSPSGLLHRAACGTVGIGFDWRQDSNL